MNELVDRRTHLPAAPVEVAHHRDRLVSWCLERRYVLSVWAAMTAWTAALLWRSWTEFERFQYGRFDLGNMTQAVWSTAHGRFLESTNQAGEQVSRLGSHVDPILALFVPLWALAPSPLTLIVVQIAALSLGALPVLWLARHHLGSERIACVFAIAYLAYPWLAWTALDAVHPVTLAIPLFLYCIWFLDTDRPWAFTPFAFLTLLTGELMGVTVAALGVWYALAGGRRRWGIAIAVIGSAWSVLATTVVVPAFAGGSSAAYGNYRSLGGTPEGVVRTAVTDPGAVVSALVTPHHLLYLVWLGVPLAGMFALAPSLAAVATPQLVANGLSDTTSMTDPRLHYIAAVIPFLLAASAFGVARLRPDRRATTALLILMCCVAFSVFLGPWPGSLAGTRSGEGAHDSPSHRAALRTAVSLVPAQAAVSSTNLVGSHLSARRYVYTVPIVGRARWIVVDTLDPVLWSRRNQVLVFAPTPALLRAFVLRIAHSSRWTKILDKDGVLVFRRTIST